MPQYYYQIKGLNADGQWAWPPLISGKIEAVDRKEAREMIEQEYGATLPMGRIKDSAEKQSFLLSIEDITHKSYMLDRFVVKNCQYCGKDYTLNDKYLINAGGAQSFCSSDCATDFKNKEGILYNVNFDFNGIHEPVIYKITSKTTGMCYIGKTTQAFTLRWYQHFYQSCGTKFHAAIKELGLTDWTFEVVEVVECEKVERHAKMLERESYWIKHFDSVANGYNSVISKKDEVLPNENQVELFHNLLPKYSAPAEKEEDPLKDFFEDKSNTWWQNPKKNL